MSFSQKQIEQAVEMINNADAIVLGTGSGLSAAGGLNYGSPELVKKWYPEYYKAGFKSLFDIVCNYWRIEDHKPELYWSYWARHIKRNRYDFPLSQPYIELSKIMKGRNYFTINTNGDGQYEKSELNQDRVYAPQGNYDSLQCTLPCSDEIYDSYEYVKKMVENMPNKFEVRSEDVPKCPRCGRLLKPNLRCDETFVEKPHMVKRADYINFIENNKDKQILFMELGVGFNSPGVIRNPFEVMVYNFPNAKLLRINLNNPQFPSEIAHKTLSIKGDLLDILTNINKVMDSKK